MTISFNLPPNVSLGAAVDQLQTIKASLNVPASIITQTFGGTAQVFEQALGNQVVLIGAAIVVIYHRAGHPL